MKVIQIQTLVYAPIEKVWQLWTNPEAIIKWNCASVDWQTIRAKNDLKVGGQFEYRMESKDGMMGFDFSGIYESVELYKQICYRIEDGRRVSIFFESDTKETQIIKTFEPEDVNPIALQEAGWQSILNSFKRYTENG